MPGDGTVPMMRAFPFPRSHAISRRAVSDNESSRARGFKEERAACFLSFEVAECAWWGVGPKGVCTVTYACIPRKLAKEVRQSRLPVLAGQARERTPSEVEAAVEARLPFLGRSFDGVHPEPFDYAQDELRRGAPWPACLSPKRSGVGSLCSSMAAWAGWMLNYQRNRNAPVT